MINYCKVNLNRSLDFHIGFLTITPVAYFSQDSYGIPCNTYIAIRYNTMGPFILKLNKTTPYSSPNVTNKTIQILPKLKC